MQTLKYLKQVNYFYLISQILKIWYTIKRFAESQNVTQTYIYLYL